MSWLLDLSDVQGPEQRVTRQEPASALRAQDDDGYRVRSPIDVDLRVLKDDERYQLVGQLAATVELDCCRCLEPLEHRVSLDVDLRYLPFRENAGEGEAEIAEEDLSTAYYRDDQIDMGAMVREQFQLSLPMKPLCRDDCRGLCPACGINLNHGRCSCDTRWRDPRLAALESVLAAGRKG